MSDRRATSRSPLSTFHFPPSTAGIVHLVGAGPGDPKLITVGGLEALRQADVVVYDHLVAERLLDACRPGARLIYAGKEQGRHTASQETINRLMIRHAKAGRRVVRLKGGDPVVFGRGGEEGLALAQAGVPFEMIPGVSSAVAVPAYAGIPVTHRGISSSVLILTAHEREPDGGRWSSLDGTDQTLVILMGVSRLEETVAALLATGRSANTPCAVIERGTLARQRTVVGALSTIAGQCRQARIQPPAVAIVGEVVRLRDELNWFERRPLFGRRIVVTRPADRADALAERLEALGAEVITLPAIQLAPLRPNGVFSQAVREIDRFDWVVFTSPEGIGRFQHLLAARRRDLRILRGRHIAAIGPKTAEAIRQRGIHVDFVPEAYSQEGLLKGLRQRRRLAGARALILNAEGSRDVLEQGLKGSGVEVTRVPLYRAVIPAELIRRAARVFRDPVDWVTVTSASCAEHLAEALRQAGVPELVATLRFASIGPVSSAAIRRLGGRVAVEARVSTIDGLVEAIVSSMAHPISTRQGGPGQRGGRRRAIPRASTS